MSQLLLLFKRLRVKYRPILPHHTVRVLRGIYEIASNEENELEDSPLLRRGIKHIVNIWEKYWRVWQKWDVSSKREDEDTSTLVPSITFLLFCIMAVFRARGFLEGFYENMDVGSVIIYDYGKDVLLDNKGKPYIEGAFHRLSVEDVENVLMVLNGNWFRYNWAHFVHIDPILNALTGRVLDMVMMPEIDKETLKEMETSLRRLRWTQAIRSFFEVAAFGDMVNFQEEQYRLVLSNVNKLFEKVRHSNTYTDVADVRKYILTMRVLPATLEVVARTRGIAKGSVHDDLLDNALGTKFRSERLDLSLAADIKERLWSGEIDDVRAREVMILDHIISYTAELYKEQIGGFVKKERHLWNISAIKKIAKSKDPYIIQAAGSFVLVCEGVLYPSMSLEETFARFVMLTGPKTKFFAELFDGNSGAVPAIDYDPSLSCVSIEHFRARLAIDNETIPLLE